MGPSEGAGGAGGPVEPHTVYWCISKLFWTHLFWNFKAFNIHAITSENADIPPDHPMELMQFLSFTIPD